MTFLNKGKYCHTGGTVLLCGISDLNCDQKVGHFTPVPDK